MKKTSSQRIHQFRECLSPLGIISCRPLFGGYSLSIDNTVFAMMTEGEIYLRVCEQSVEYRVEHKSPLLVIRKNGRLTALKYYHINEALWDDKEMLYQLSAFSLQTARNEKQQLRNSGRLKNLPNISFHMELQLINVGITDEQTLREIGAKEAWLKLLKTNKALTVKVLYSLEGAVAGVHVAALPVQRRQELKEWATKHQRKRDIYSVCTLT
ncbi:TfoX/Sxy family DNA transformation protein [Klebsiella indica]|uniref:TfoX/Sxy family DNA transformation protein n=1 Tax=Klebsiella indica TaxID=2582917 RepID=A0A5R9LJG8_9ENTR|nr:MULTISPECIES: TfoX/Sxy family DNA transformation protein [Klebsiella]TLV19946.1 TfoX/Sxy family DNA transformation protein [Klebsiella indica]